MRFLLDNGLNAENATPLAGGAAGDFSTMSFERLGVAEIVMDEASGRVPLAFGGQTTSTRELTRLADAASAMGFDFLQVSCPFYFTHTEADFEEFVTAGAATAKNVGIIVYNTFWTATNLSAAWSRGKDPQHRRVEMGDAAYRRHGVRGCHLAFLRPVHHHRQQSVLSLIGDAALGARAFEVHLCNYWPEWGVKLIDEVKRGDYAEIARMMVEEAMPFYKLWTRIEREYTSGDGYLDKLCMELIGLPSSRCRPPTRDIRQRYRAAALAMMQTGVPRLKDR